MHADINKLVSVYKKSADWIILIRKQVEFFLETVKNSNFDYFKEDMLKKLKFLIYTKPFIFFAYYFIRIYSLTFRLQVVNEKKWQSLLKQGKTILLCTWHQQFFSAIRHFKTYSKFNPGLMISQSRDGDLISGVANKTGWHTPRGSSSRGEKGNGRYDRTLDAV